ncbi:hypothetical protein CVT25_001816 [Psilocybe cyanescens]|uniref:Protein kinase domain-containing protein n=1 Tax=Psilocybe cyanescens TaxID=93625 RepID=A0A409WQH9_PSICY|nr:hypothetical protein CVT25_001816 [Psilocybe cyanescens]
MSPELMQKGSYDSKSDIRSLGCLIYKLCVLKRPSTKPRPTRNSASSSAPHLPAPQAVTILLVDLTTTSAQYTRQIIEHTANQAVALRKEKLHVLVVMKREELALTIAQREEAVMEAVRVWEVEIDQACMRREEAVWKEEWRLEDIKREGEAEMRKVEAGLAKGRGRKNPLKEVNIHLEPPSRVTARVKSSKPRRRKQEPQPTPCPNPSHQANPTHSSDKNHTNTNTSNGGATTNTNNGHTTTIANPALETPTASCPFTTYSSEFTPVSAMKGVVLTSTGEMLATPSLAELVSLVKHLLKQKRPQSDLQQDLQRQQHRAQMQTHVLDDDEELDSLPPSLSERKERERRDNTMTTAVESWPRRRRLLQGSAGRRFGRPHGLLLHT